MTRMIGNLLTLVMFAGCAIEGNNLPSALPSEHFEPPAVVMDFNLYPPLLKKESHKDGLLRMQKIFEEGKGPPLSRSQEFILGLYQLRKEGKLQPQLNCGMGSVDLSGIMPPARYRNPEDESQTWTGKGLMPQWIQDQLDEGATLDQLLAKSRWPQ